MGDPVDFVSFLVASLIPFLPALFGGVQFIKTKKNLSGPVVEWLSIGLFVFYGVLVLIAYFFPSWGSYLLGGAVFLLMCALAPSGFYKFINERTTKSK